jgi:hypothetical protein
MGSEFRNAVSRTIFERIRVRQTQETYQHERHPESVVVRTRYVVCGKQRQHSGTEVRYDARRRRFGGRCFSDAANGTLAPRPPK